MTTPPGRMRHATYSAFAKKADGRIRLGSCLAHIRRGIYESRQEARSGPGGTTRGRSNEVSDKGMSRIDVFRMIQRRATKAGISSAICCHSFGATGITVFLENGGAIETAAKIAAHESPRTTKLYDRRVERVALEEVDRIRL